MDEIRAWLERAARFVEQVAGYHWKVSTEVSLSEPASPDEIELLNYDLPFPIPIPLQNLYLNGAARCEITYSWEITEALLPELEEVLDSDWIVGGPSLLAPDELAETIECLRAFAEEAIGSFDSDEARVARIRWENAFPFIDLSNGDYLAFDISKGGENPPILYLNHEMWDESGDETVFQSFDALLEDWEYVCYLSPDFWLMLDPDCMDRGTHRLIRDSRLATGVRAILDPARHR